MKQIPPHGTSRRYRHGPNENDEPGPCRCTPCRKDAGKQVELWRLNGRAMVDAKPVRRHVKSLKRAGLPYMTIARLAGVKYVVLTRLLYGEPSRGMRPSRRLRKENAQALLAVRVEHVGDEGRVLALGSVRRLQALARLGWSFSRLAQEIDSNHQHLSKVANGRVPTVTARLAHAIAAAYDRLWQTDPVADGIPRAGTIRTLATRRGWASALAWDDIDNPSERPRGVCQEAS